MTQLFCDCSPLLSTRLAPVGRGRVLPSKYAASSSLVGFVSVLAGVSVLAADVEPPEKRSPTLPTSPAGFTPDPSPAIKLPALLSPAAAKCTPDATNSAWRRISLSRQANHHTPLAIAAPTATPPKALQIQVTHGFFCGDGTARACDMRTALRRETSANREENRTTAFYASISGGGKLRKAVSII